FPRFCMFQLLSKKKKGVIQCPLCKTEVTKRSLKENSRFKQLIEGLLETLHAFELDTGVKFLNSRHVPKTSTEATAAELLCKESSVVQSKGFRNRKKSAKGNGQENCTLEAHVDAPLTDTVVKRCSLRNKTQKRDSEKAIYIDLGKICKISLLNRLEDKEELQISPQENAEELKSAEKGNEDSCTTRPDKLGAKEVILPDVIGESDFTNECLSKKSTRGITEYAQPAQGNGTENQSSPLNVLPAELTEQPDSPLRNGDASFFKNTEEMDAEQTPCGSNSEEFDLKESRESRLDKGKEIDIAQGAEAVEMDEPETDSLNEKEPLQEKLLQPETLDCAALNQVSSKRLKRSIQKVNEWFSKSKEIPSRGSFQEDSAEATDISGEGDASSSDKESCVSQKTDPVVDSKEIAVAEENKRWSKETADSIKDKIFGKTYKRERKSTPAIIFRDVLPTKKKEDAAPDKSWNNSSKDRPKRKRKTVSVLRPEDFIKKKDVEETDGCPESVNLCLGDAEKKRYEENTAVNESHPSENKEDNTVAEVEEGGGSIRKKAAEKVIGKHCDTELDLNNCDQKSTKKNGSAAKRSRRSTRTMCALELVVDRHSLSPDAAEPQIDSYPSSEEPRKADLEQRQVRRSRRLQLLSEEMTKEMEKGVIKGAKKHESDHEGSFSGVQRNVLVHVSECQEQCEPQGVVSNQPLAHLKGGDLEANEMQISLKNSLDAAESGKILLNRTSCRQHSNCSFFAPDTGSQESEIRGSPLLLEPPSTSSHLTEEVSESPIAFPQDSRHNMLKVPGGLRTEKVPMAKNGLEVTEEVEDSELDTQYLRNIFRHSKRLSFSLYPTKVLAVGDAASETLKRSCADQGENKRSKYLKTESLQEEKTESLSRVCGKEPLKANESCVSPVTCFVGDTECAQAEDHEGVAQAEDHQEDVSQVANQENLTPIGMGTARTEDKSRSQKGEQENEKTVSTDIGIESELRQNPVKSKRSQSDQGNTEEQVFKRAHLNTVDEMCSSSESDQAGKAEGVDGKAPLLHFQYKSMICPVTCQQRPAEFSCEGTGKKSSKRERKQVKVNEEAATGTGMPKGLVTQALEEPFKGNSDFTGSSETPDGLLCSDDDIEENTSFSETDRRERSAVFVKRSNNDLVKELHNRNTSSKPSSRGIPRSRRRARKLQSSDESSEDEDLPCFQALINGKSASTPLQTNKQVPSVVESPLSPVALPPHGSNDDNNAQKMPGAAPSSGCVSPSPGSECSVNLFSSQSNMSEESVDGAQEPKKPSIQVHPSKQASTANEGKEASPSCNKGLKRSKTNSKDECQEDQNVGANPGEASGSDSETSYVEDSCGPFSQGEILTTQQKNIMQNNLKKLQQEMAELEAALEEHGSQDCEFLPVHKNLPPSSGEGALGMEQMGKERENAGEQNSGTRLNSASVLPNISGNVTRSPSKSSSSVRLLNPQAAEATTSSAAAPNADKSWTQECKSTRSSCFPASVPHNAAGKASATSPVVTSRKEMSFVASGLTQSEHVVVQKFARKTQSTLSNQITEGTTHVIMKTDKELVCERTLKYFLGIAGRKWVVSYQWVIESFKEGRILDEENFEVRGDVINGRNHQGPRRARQALTDKIFKDFEICCYGPFTDMTTEHLEWMVELCGASVVKQPHLFTRTRNSTAVVVVQPDAWMEDMDYGAMQQKTNVAMVTREWVLDSVACYKCQELETYLVS
ncbi:BRCA1 protein, partial [Columbina picui]|nr:BRCA1 protein [Columbina picui]